MNPCDTIRGVNEASADALHEAAFHRKVETGGKFTLTNRKRL